MFYEFKNVVKEKKNHNPHDTGLVAGYLTCEELQKVAGQFGFADSTVALCQEANNIFRSGIETYDDYTFTELKVLNINNKDDYHNDFVALYFKRDTFIVIDILDKDMSTHEKFEHALKRFTPATMTLEKLIYAFFDELLSKDVRVIEELGLQVSNLEESVLSGKPDDDINLELLTLKRRLLEMHNYYEQCLDIFETLDANENDLFDTDTLMYITNITQRTIRLREDVDSINNAIVHLQDAYSAYLDKKMNNTMKYLTVLSTIFFPLTIIVGWYGMNFTHMPELKWEYGYLYVVLLSIGVILIVALIAKKLKWFK